MKTSNRRPVASQSHIVSSLTCSSILLAALASLIVSAVACSSTSSSGGSGGCADISGNWKISSVRTDGDCDKTKFNGGDETYTFQKGTNGSWIASTPKLSGGCPGTLNASTCRFVATCEITSGGTKVESVGVDWTFSGNTVTGTDIIAAFPPAATPACNANYNDTGTR